MNSLSSINRRKFAGALCAIRHLDGRADNGRKVSLILSTAHEWVIVMDPRPVSFLQLRERNGRVTLTTLAHRTELIIVTICLLPVVSEEEGAPIVTKRSQLLR